MTHLKDAFGEGMVNILLGALRSAQKSVDDNESYRDEWYYKGQVDLCLTLIDAIRAACA